MQINLSMRDIDTTLVLGRTLNFRQAAAQLHLSQSALSTQIQRIEDALGVRLFDRTSRRVALTDQGRDAYGVAKAMLEETRALAQRLSPEPQDRPFRIRIFVSLAVRWLLPRLSSFYARNPELCLSIETVSGEVVETSGDCDAYVLYLREGLDERPLTVLFDEYLVPVCAPTLGDGQALPRSLEALGHHALIHGSTGRHEWNLWLKAHHDQPERAYKHLMFNLDDLALDAAARGLGVAMTDRMLAHDALLRGDLVVPFGQPLKTGAVYALWLRDSGVAHPACTAVLRWFEEQLEQTRGR